MSLVDVARLRYSYPHSTRPSLDDVSFTIPPGKLVLLAGPSGSGKSTLLRSLTGLIPQFYGGRHSGSVSVAGFDPVSTPARRMAAIAGLLFQEAGSQTIGDTVEEDVAFALEQRNMPRQTMAAKVRLALESAGATHLAGRRMATLSGGERQRVAIAATLALEPRLLLLDEPSSQLDPEGEARLLETVIGLRDRTGLTLLVAEHRLHRWLPAAERTLAVDSGRVRELDGHQAAQLSGAPPVCELGRRLGLSPLPLSAASARASLAMLGRRPRVSPRQDPASPGEELLRTSGLAVELGGRQVLRDASLTLREGEIVALAGPNGSGKTTLLRAIAGTVKAASGTVSFRGRPAPESVSRRTSFAALCPQDPGQILTQETAAAEVRSTLRARHHPGREEDVLSRWGLQDHAFRDPRDLSTGERERVGMAAMVAHDPPVWLLDEPSRGAGHRDRERLIGQLRDRARDGGAALVATHDLEFAAHFATRVTGIEGGRITFDLPVREALGSRGPLPTQTAQIIPGALTPEDVSW